MIYSSGTLVALNRSGRQSAGQFLVGAGGRIPGSGRFNLKCSVHFEAVAATRQAVECVQPNGMDVWLTLGDLDGLNVAVNRVWIEVRIMTFRPALFAFLVTLLLSAGASAQDPTPESRDAADFRVEVWAIAAADFDARMLIYSDLRADLQQGLPPLRLTDDPREILKAEHALAKRIRAARSGAHGGTIFTPEISSAFRHALVSETRASTCASILDDNPGAFSYQVNDTYPKRRPLSTVPGGILMLLPRLPADVDYRFLGRHLILHDTRANVILDRIPQAIACPDSHD